MVTERTIINALIIGASFILVPFVVSSTLTFDYGPAIFLGGLLAFVVAFFFLREKLCVCPLLGGCIAGSLNFLPLALQATHIACILLILYYITGYVIIKQRRIKLGKTKYLWPIMIVTSIVLYHNHSLSVHTLGGDTEGGKPAILIYLVVIAYFCGINIVTPSVDFLSKVPLYSVILTGLSCIPFFLTTYIPGLAPILYSVTDSVNVEAYYDAQGGTDISGGSAVSRLAGFGTFGTALQLYLLCYYPIGTWLRPERWWVAGLSLFCTACVVAAGYRGGIFSFAMLTMVGAWCYYSWRSLFLPAALFIVVLVLFVGSSNNLIYLPTKKLPLIAQRTLSFLPADWDQEAVDSGKSSNEFRQNIQNVYIKEYLTKSPLFGNGFDINTKIYEDLNQDLIHGGGDREYLQARLFIEGKLFHTGWMSVYDCVGIVGSIAFIVLAWNQIKVLAHFIFGPKADRRSSLFPLYVWMMCKTVTVMVTFFTVFGDFKDTFIGLCVYAIVLSHLSDVENTTEAPIVPSDRKGQVEFNRLSGAYYGYQSKP
jgi:hypothetical protein